jgi:hypothetical protein
MTNDTETGAKALVAAPSPAAVCTSWPARSGRPEPRCWPSSMVRYDFGSFEWSRSRGGCRAPFPRFVQVTFGVM